RRRAFESRGVLPWSPWPSSYVGAAVFAAAEAARRAAFSAGLRVVVADRVFPHVPNELVVAVVHVAEAAVRHAAHGGVPVAFLSRRRIGRQAHALRTDEVRNRVRGADHLQAVRAPLALQRLTRKVRRRARTRLNDAVRDRRRRSRPRKVLAPPIA